ncbi:MAG: hypothetical protein QOF98_1557, partial [Streptomyces sp.]|nr:hypothetical protein [Streptomyces sp.]
MALEANLGFGYPENHGHLSRIRVRSLRQMYEGVTDNGVVRMDYGYSGELQELVDEVSALLGAPATLEDRDFRLIAFGVHDSEDGAAMDPVRTRSILTRRSTTEVRAWFERFGITRATAPVRIPAEPAAGVLRGRLCLPVRHGGVVHGYVWLLDEADHSPAQLAAAMSVAARIGDLLSEGSLAGSQAGAALRSLLTTPSHVSRAARNEAEDALRSALGPDADQPHALVCVRPAGTERPADELPSPRAIPSAAALTRVPSPTPTREGPDLVALLVRLRSPHVLVPARTAATRLLEALGSPGTAGVSDGRPELGGLVSAWREAVDAARAVRAQPLLGPVGSWGELGAYRLLTALPADTPPDPAVAPLLTPPHRELAHTAEVFLDHAGQAGRTAAALAIHR